MGEAHGRVGGVDTLAAGAAGAEQVLADIGRIKFDIKLAGFRENGHGGG